ncbi:hypothetical protein [Sorangium atrum]|uniref:Lipoprotein n=1 Tax=Sorangium atrum TaxID=2995308 RepID=A0ABT5C9X7_9BACT|nr:hypothetical protein [Sorangium aterium]MDC0682418.1 hypothetical protein [Sorangium aterium]
MRTTFWAGMVGACVACGLSGLGCGGDDDGATPSGSTGSTGSTEGGGSGAASCSGLDTSALVSELSPAEVDQACKGYRRCSAEEVTVEYVCLMQGVLGAAYGDDPGTNDAELQAKCSELVEGCMADPSQAEQLIEQALVEVEAEPCGQPRQCTATIAEIDACAAEMRAYTRGVLPACSALTMAFYEQTDRGDTLLDGACGKLGVGCFQLFTTPNDG